MTPEEILGRMECHFNPWNPRTSGSWCHPESLSTKNRSWPQMPFIFSQHKHQNLCQKKEISWFFFYIPRGITIDCRFTPWLGNPPVMGNGQWPMGSLSHDNPGVFPLPCVSIYIYICVYIYIYVYINICIHTHLHIYIYMYVYVYVNI